MLSVMAPLLGSRESAPTNNRKFTSDKRQQAQGKWACARGHACARRQALSVFFAQRAVSPIKWLF